MDNVNNLNGVPNFGHGYPSSEVPAPTESETPAMEDGEVELTSQDEVE